MGKENIKSIELQRAIAANAGKFDFEDVTEEDLGKIQDIIIRQYQMDGVSTDINFKEIEELPQLEHVIVGDFEIKPEDVESLKKLKSLQTIQFSNCSFGNLDKSNSTFPVEIISFAGCTNVENVNTSRLRFIKVIGGELDFSKMNIDNAEEVIVQNSTVLNMPSLKGKKALRVANFDGSTVYDINGKEIEEIEVDDTTYSSLNAKVDVEDIER